MQWYYSADGQQAGPVSEQELDSLAKSGTIQPNTLVWREGMPNWAPYASLNANAPLSAGALAATIGAPGTSRCPECGRLSVCSLHRTKRRNVILIAWGLVVASIVAFIAAGVYDQAALVVPGVLLFLGGLIYGMAKGRLVYATKIDDVQLRMAGCGEEFLNQFPEWTGT